MGDSMITAAFGIFDRLPTPYHFDKRSPMSYRLVLRSLPKPLRRQWLTQRYRYSEPRVAISRLYSAGGR